MERVVAIVLAGGQGKRMKSRLPKVLHPAAGRPLVHYPIAAALSAGAERVVVVVSAATEAPILAHVQSAFGEGRVTTAVQASPRGTGDAAAVGLAAAGEADRVLILCGDAPLVGEGDLKRLLATLDDAKTSLALLSAEPADPRGYGRVVRDPSGRLAAVREDRDLEPGQRETLREVNSGFYAVRRDTLRDGLATLTTDNSQGELYLTDVVAFAARQGGAAAVLGHPAALVGVNDRSQLAYAEEALFVAIAERHRIAGVTVRAGARIDDTVSIGEDARIEAGVHLRGLTRIGASAVVDAGSVIVDSEVEETANVKPYSVIVESKVGPGAQIGPFSHLRPGSIIEADAHIGNFVETKKTRIGRGAKANHLSYLGDGDVGAKANIGAGTIFCNYDGFSKHKTVIGEEAFIGSDSQIVAPVTIGKGAYVATGTTVTKDVPDDALAIGRAKQETKPGYASRLKARLAASKKKA
jgi:bifunctional UDP-N-acetylglucosamine pyrophosphorylase/glucosamine-1-phosphate N-acetyltransferase